MSFAAHFDSAKEIDAVFIISETSFLAYDIEE